VAERSEPTDPNAADAGQVAGTPGSAAPSAPTPDAPPRIVTWHQAELNAVRWLRSHGYPDAVPVQGGAQTGADVRGTYLVARVVFGNASVTRADVQQLVQAGGSDGAHLAMLASSKYELPAVTYADAKGVMLLAYDEAGTITPRNTGALAIVPEAERRAARSNQPTGPWVPVLRHAPLAVAVYQLAFTATLVLSAARTGQPVAVGNVAFGLLVAAALSAFWYFVSRHLGRPKRTAPAETPPEESDPGSP
jgi:hypothetical protein